MAESTLRQAASEIGIAHQTLHSFLQGKGKPHARTHALLLDWYGRDENEVLRLREEVADVEEGACRVPDEAREVTSPAVDVLRQAAERAVDRTSLRSTADQIGMTHRGLRLFLEGSDPRSETVAKLRACSMGLQRAARPTAKTTTRRRKDVA